MNAIAAEIKLDEAALRELEGSFRGQLVPPGDPAYDEHRKVWNGSIDRSPALIARCSGVADVIAAVRFARTPGFRSRSEAEATASRDCPSATAAWSSTSGR